MDSIFIEKLIVKGSHGVSARERKVEQEFEISFRLAVGDTSKAAKSQKLKDAVDYQPIKDMIVEVIEGKSYFLIETLAETIVQNILKDKRIKSLEFTIKKPEVWESGVPGLTIVRTR